jgi:hypothetical protein
LFDINEKATIRLKAEFLKVIVNRGKQLDVYTISRNAHSQSPNQYLKYSHTPAPTPCFHSLIPAYNRGKVRGSGQHHYLIRRPITFVMAGHDRRHGAAMLLYPVRSSPGIFFISSSAVHQPLALSIDFIISGSEYRPIFPPFI